LEVGVIEVSLSAAPPKVTPISEAPKAAAQPTGWLALAVGVVAVAASIALGAFVSPSLLFQARRSATPPSWAPAEIAGADEAVRATLALETYRAMHGVYPPDLLTLGTEGFLPPAAARAISRRYAYQSDGATYTRVER
jgi:hypothetical protein